MLGCEFQDAVRGWDTEEGSDAVRFGFFDSVAIVELENVRASEPDNGTRAERFTGKAVSGGEGLG